MDHGVFFIGCQCSFTPRYFHSASFTLSLTMLLYSSHIYSSLSFHTHTLGLNFLCRLFVALNCMSVTNNLCFSAQSSFGNGMTLTLQNFAFVLLSHNNIINRTFNRTSSICHQLGFLLHEQSVSDH